MSMYLMITEQRSIEIGMRPVFYAFISVILLHRSICVVRPHKSDPIKYNNK